MKTATEPRPQSCSSAAAVNSQPASARSSSGHYSALAEVPERVRQIAMMRGLGYSYREIAGSFSVTPQAVSLMLMRHRRSLKSLRGAMELSALSPRAVNALGRHGIRTREQARQANVFERLDRERNCGSKTLEEIARWMEDDAGNPAGSNGQSSAGHDLHHV
jgi:hypothetical protein